MGYSLGPRARWLLDGELGPDDERPLDPAREAGWAGAPLPSPPLGVVREEWFDAYREALAARSRYREILREKHWATWHAISNRRLDGGAGGYLMVSRSDIEGMGGDDDGGE